MRSTRTSARRRATYVAAVLAMSSGLVAGAAQPAHAQVLVPVPPGCGSFSGQLVPANTIDDHSADTVGLGEAFTPHQVPANAAMITIGTPFIDFIQGNAVSEVICGLGDGDVLWGGGGTDDIFGGPGVDTLLGESNADHLNGGEGEDYIYGDDLTNSHGTLDGADTLQGGQQDDLLHGGAGFDVIRGGPGVDEGQGQDGLGTCDASVDDPHDC